MSSLDILLSRRLVRRWLPTFVLVCGVVAAWGLLAAAGADNKFAVPSPVVVIEAFGRLAVSQDFWHQAAISLTRVLIGSILAVVIGFPLGLIAGFVRTIDHALTPLMSFLRYIPPTSFLTLLIVYLGIGEGYKIAVVCIGVVFFAYQLAIDSIRGIDPRFFEIALSSGMSRARVFWHIGVRGSAPALWDSARIVLSGGWTFLVAAEVVGADSGLGFFINQSQRFLRIGELYAAILLIGLIGIVSDFCLSSLRNTFTPWARSQTS
jgi:NitT/TauT family transport system permease protein